MKSIKEYITEVSRKTIEATVIVTNQLFDNRNINLKDWYKKYVPVLISKCKNSAILKPFTLKASYENDGDGIYLKGINKDNILEFLYQLDSVFDSMDYDKDFYYLNLKLTRKGLQSAFSSKDYWNIVEEFCDKYNL